MTQSSTLQSSFEDTKDVTHKVLPSRVPREVHELKYGGKVSAKGHKELSEANVSSSQSDRITYLIHLRSETRHTLPIPSPAVSSCCHCCCCCCCSCCHVTLLRWDWDPLRASSKPDVSRNQERIEKNRRKDEKNRHFSTHN